MTALVSVTLSSVTSEMTGGVVSARVVKEYSSDQASFSAGDPSFDITL